MREHISDNLATKEDLEKQVAINTERGWPGMFASLDCMHYEWKNCPTAWQGTFQDREGKNSIILEAIADMACGYGMPSLVCLGEIMTLMYLIVVL